MNKAYSPFTITDNMDTIYNAVERTRKRGGYNDSQLKRWTRLVMQAAETYQHFVEMGCYRPSWGEAIYKYVAAAYGVTRLQIKTGFAAFDKDAARNYEIEFGEEWGPSKALK